jgi:hypothetical protein
MRVLTLDEIKPREGGSFELALGDRTLAFTLAKVHVLPDSGREGGAFTLDWTGPYEPVLPQDIYTLRHDGAEFEMFIVAVGRTRDSVQYEAVFN